MSFLRARLLGKFHVTCCEQTISDLPTKSRELLFYVLFYQERPHFRETLADMMWCDCPTTKSRSYLRKALWQLQSCLASYSNPDCEQLLIVDAEWVQINPVADVWTDVSMLQRAFRQVQGLPGEGLDAGQVRSLTQAVQLYLGDLLEECYSDWCLREREWCRFMYMACLDKLLDYYTAKHNYEAGVTYGKHILRYDRARERTHRKMMRLYYLAGDRVAALRQYAQCKTALNEELSIGPTRRTELLYRQILAERLDVISPISRVPKSLSALPSEASSIFRSLQELQSLLGRIQSQLGQFVQDAEIDARDST